MNTKVIKCTCKHDFQDRRYGAGMRVMNELPKKGWSCTVCGERKRFGGQSVPTVRS